MRLSVTKIRKFGPFLIAAVSCLILEASVLSGSTSQAQEAVRPQKPLQHQVSVTLKLIQVLVTDKKGNPVTDLRKEDFVLYDNGKEQKLTEFERHDLKLPTTDGTPADERVAPTQITSAPLLLNRKLFFLFDFAYTNPQGARRAVQEALRFIDTRLLPTDEVAVISYSALQRLRIHQFLTSDHSKIRKAVESFGLHSALTSTEDLGEKPSQESGAEDEASPWIDSGSISPAGGT